MNKNQKFWLLFAVALLMMFNNIGGTIILQLDWITITFANAGTFLLFYIYYQTFSKKK